MLEAMTLLGTLAASLVVAGMTAACSGESPAATPAEPGSDRVAYDRWRQPERLIAALALEPGHRIADIGAGHGYLEPYLVRAVGERGRVLATDIDADALATIEARGLPVETRLVQPDDPGLEPGAYDRVLLAQVDHLLDDRAGYLRALVPALAPGGHIAVANRVDREPGLREAAAAAGLVVVGEHRDLPAQFVLLLAPSGVEEPRP
jgi:SAM-dependent methyltransferase